MALINQTTRKPSSVQGLQNLTKGIYSYSSNTNTLIVSIDNPRMGGDGVWIGACLINLAGEIIGPPISFAWRDDDYTRIANSYDIILKD